MNECTEELSQEIIGFQNEIADIQTAIADFEAGKNLNVAIIAEPFAGRTTLANAIEKMNPHKVTKVSFSSIAKNKDLLLLKKEKRILIIDDCQFLYMRKIEGFDILEEFFELIVSSDNIFITTWNLYSWDYLDKVVHISKYFPVQINLPKFTPEQIKELITSRYAKDEITFVEDVGFEKEKLVEVVHCPFTLKPWKKSITIPFLKIRRSVLYTRLFRKEEKIGTENLIFDKIYHISNGNPGVAKVVWEKSLEYPTIKPSRIKEFSSKIDLDYNEAYILNIILSMKSIKKTELQEIAGPDFNIDSIVFRLGKQGLITETEGCCKTNPEAMQSIVQFMKKLRLVW